MKHRILPILFCTLLALGARASDGTTPPGEAELLAQLQLAQVQAGAGKRAFVEGQLGLTPDEAEAFWPVFDAHQQALAELNRRRVVNILAYARAWESGGIDRKSGDELASEAIAIEEDEAAALKRTYRKLKRALPADKAIRYLQVESKLRAIIRFEQAAAVPYAPIAVDAGG